MYDCSLVNEERDDDVIIFVNKCSVFGIIERVGVYLFIR